MCEKLIALLLASFFVVNCGCHYFYDQVGEAKRIPFPISDDFPYSIEGEIYRVWCGNELQIKSEIHTAYLILQGVNNPDMGEQVEQEAIVFLHSLLKHKIIRADVYELDPRKRTIAQVYCGDTHLNFEMIKNGWGQCDGTEHPDMERFAAAEKLAREKRIGIWAYE